VKTTVKPHEDLLMVLTAVWILLDQLPERKFDANTNTTTINYWPTAKRIMQDMKFL